MKYHEVSQSRLIYFLLFIWYRVHIWVELARLYLHFNFRNVLPTENYYLFVNAPCCSHLQAFRFYPFMKGPLSKPYFYSSFMIELNYQFLSFIYSKKMFIDSHCISSEFISSEKQPLKNGQGKKFFPSWNWLFCS